jgi:predicted phosphoribosyltransferase
LPPFSTRKATQFSLLRKRAAPLDLLLVRQIGVPTKPELAMGSVIDGGAPVVVRSKHALDKRVKRRAHCNPPFGRMDENIREKILTLLDQHRSMTIATLRVDGWPQATTVEYVNEGLSPGARKRKS